MHEYFICYTTISQKMGSYKFSLLSHKRLTLLIPDANTNLQPYWITPLPVGKHSFYRCKYPRDTRFTFDFDVRTASIGEKVRYARITAGFEQEELARMIGVDRTTLLHLENGQVSDEYMSTTTLTKAAIACGRETTFCCDEYHAFMADGYGAKIRGMRKEKGWTQMRLASQMSVAVTTVKRWEKERRRPNREHYDNLMTLVQKEDM